MMRRPLAIIALRGRSLRAPLDSDSAAPSPARRGPTRSPAFTLVELMVVISIITLLASIVLVAMAGVMETAREDRTRAQIARIDALISERWEAFRRRRVPIPLAMTHAASRNRMAKIDLDKARVDIMREMMRMELPERKSDVLFGPVVLPPTSTPALWRAYRRHAATLITQRRGMGATRLDDKWIDKNLDNLWSSDFEAAECLYLILSQIMDQGAKAMEFFSAREIGDIDNDGMPEILDGWGRPIIFLRWAPGLQIAGSPQDGNSPDPFDLMQIYPRFHSAPTFALYPLIASSGPDRQMEIFADNPSETNRITYALTQPPNNPFLGLPGVATYQNQTMVMVGSPQDSNGDGVLGWIDNITNHNLTGS
jgi:prepilin-type N-terminal cleavage/methylation domain-containing protein